MKELGDLLPDATIESIKSNRVALKGPLETPVGKGFRSINVALRKEFDLYANLRPAKTILTGGRLERIRTPSPNRSRSSRDTPPSGSRGTPSSSP